MSKNTIKNLRQAQRSGSSPIISPSDPDKLDNSTPVSYQNSTLESVIQKQTWRFHATHLLIGRLSNMSKDDLLADFDIIATNLDVQFNREEFCLNFDKKKFQLFPQSAPVRFHVLLTLLDPVLATSVPSSPTSNKTHPVFSFSHKANPPRFTHGTSNRFTLQFLKDVSFDKLHSLDEGLALRGGFSEDPCLLSLLLHSILQKVTQTENSGMSLDSTTPIFETRGLVIIDKGRRLYKEELFLVFRSIPALLPYLPTNNLSCTSVSILGWKGLIAPSVSHFENTSTADPSLLKPYNSLTLSCKPDDTILSSLYTAQSLGIDLSSLQLAYISRAHLQVPSRRKITDSLVMIYKNIDENIMANWSGSLPPPTFEDIQGMHSIRRLYELEARPAPLHPTIGSVHPLLITSTDRLTAALKSLKSRCKAHERRIASLEKQIKTLLAPIPDSPRVSNSALPAATKTKKKKKKAVDSQEK